MHSSFNLKLQIQKLIIVSIENTNRTRDFSPTKSTSYMGKIEVKAWESIGKANNFMNFIEQELMPKIKSTYRTTTQNMIVDHSLGGLFALHCFLDNPKLFSYYLLIEPSWHWDDNYIGKRAKKLLENKTDVKARIFIAMANNLKDDKRHYKWGKQFYSILKKNKSPNLKCNLQYFEDEKHLTVTIPATYFGLRYIFKPYEIDINEVTQNSSILADYEEKTEKGMS
jgi:predicted alpha/beta superfamily hydrolase